MPAFAYRPEKPTISVENVTFLREAVTPYFAVTHTAIDKPFRGAVLFHGRFLQDSATSFDAIQAAFAKHGFSAYFRREPDQRIVIIAEPGLRKPPPSNWQLNAGLFVLTVFSTLLTGAMSEAETAEQVTQYGRELWRGIPFAASIMLILGAHEMGHYLAARYHKVAVTLPYFIPLPFISIIGTMGAFIQIKERIKNKRALFDIGVAGPLAGLVFAVPILIYGLLTSEVGPISGGGLLEGNSLLYASLKTLIFGRFLPDGQMDVYLNQVAWAGWVGLLVTALNLMPVGQLDGGHILYALLGEKAKLFYWPVLVTLAGLTLVSFLVDSTLTWLIWLGLLLFFGRQHAETLDEITELDGRRRTIGWLTLAIFVLIFVPIPFVILPS